MRTLSVLLGGIPLLVFTAAAKVTLHAVPAEIRSDRFQIAINGRPADVAHAAGNYYFVSFDLDGKARLSITGPADGYWAKGVEVQPWRHGIRPSLDGRTIAFSIAAPVKLSISRPGDHSGSSEMLFIFANPPEVNRPRPGAPGIRYYGPGVYREHIDIKSGETIYLAAGALLLGSLNVWGAQNVKIHGRGIVVYDGPQDPAKDEGWFHRPNWHVIGMDKAHNVEVNGIICVVRSRTWMIQMKSSRGIRFDNVKVIGACPGNANQDGIDWLGGGDTVVRDCFFRASDDIFALYGDWLGYDPDQMAAPGEDVTNITIDKCVLSTSISNIVRVSWPGKVFNSRGFTLRDSDVIQMGMGGCRIPFALAEIWADPGGSGDHDDFRFDNIRLESWYSLVQLRQPKPAIRNVRMRNIWSLEQPSLVRSELSGTVDGVVFQNVNLAGTRVEQDRDIPVVALGGAKAPQYPSAGAPRASFRFEPTAPRPGTSVRFDASATAAAGSVRSYEWTFGDGASATGAVVRHVFPDARGTLLDGSGRFRVLLKVTDRRGNVDWMYRPVVVTEALREPDPTGEVRPGLAYRYYEGAWSELPDFDQLTPAATGTVASPNVSVRAPKQNYGFTFSGFLDVPADGGYTFMLFSNDAGQIKIGSHVVAVSPQPVAMVCGTVGNLVQSATGAIGLQAGRHAIRIAMTHSLGDDGFAVKWQGPNMPLSDLPAGALSHGVNR